MHRDADGICSSMRRKSLICSAYIKPKHIKFNHKKADFKGSYSPAFFGLYPLSCFKSKKEMRKKNVSHSHLSLEAFDQNGH